MKIILTKDVKNVVKCGEIKEVSDGYAKNYLIKNKYAVIYTETSNKILKNEIETRKQQEMKDIEEANKTKNKLEKEIIKFKVKTGKEDKVFGSVTAKQIKEELDKLGYNIDKKKINIDNTVSTLGHHIIKIELHKKVIAQLNIELVN